MLMVKLFILSMVDVKAHLCRVVGIDDVENNQLDVDQTEEKLDDISEPPVIPLNDLTLETHEHSPNETVVTQIENQVPIVTDQVATVDPEDREGRRYRRRSGN